jgi:diadenosine tetraphosphate (Ap4A) HIT family hydrolase
MRIADSPFGEIDAGRIVWESESALAFLDGFPVSQGHCLLVPRRVVASLDELGAEEEAELWRAARSVREILRERYEPDGFNIGINEGPAAGQTIGHAHIHIIPRYHGDQPEPRGGIRWIFPDKARYWAE